MPPTNGFESKNQMEDNETASICEKCGGTGVIQCEAPNTEGDSMEQWEQVCECRIGSEGDMSGAGEGDR